jgi:hypothetical protein
MAGGRRKPSDAAVLAAFILGKPSHSDVSLSTPAVRVRAFRHVSPPPPPCQTAPPAAASVPDTGKRDSETSACRRVGVAAAWPVASEAVGRRLAVSECGARDCATRYRIERGGFRWQGAAVRPNRLRSRSSMLDRDVTATRMRDRGLAPRRCAFLQRVVLLRSDARRPVPRESAYLECSH